jgi:ankyrin repeat protein
MHMHMPPLVARLVLLCALKDTSVAAAMRCEALLVCKAWQHSVVAADMDDVYLANHPDVAAALRAAACRRAPHALRAARLLLERRDVSMQAKNDALVLACHHDNLPCVDLLRDHGACADHDDHAALFAAVEGGHAAVVEALLSSTKANPARADARDSSALVVASMGGHLAVVQALLSAPENRARVDGLAILLAANNGHAAVLDALLTPRPARSDAQDSIDAQEYLQQYVEMFGRSFVVRALIRRN